MITYCKSRGTREIIGHVLSDNAAMLRLTEKLGFQHEASPDQDRVCVRLTLT